MKDRIGNKLAIGDKVVVALPEAQVFGFLAEVVEQGVLYREGTTQRRGTTTPGRVLVSCVIALPVDPDSQAVLQLVKVYDVDKENREAAAAAVSASGQPN